MKLKHSQGCNHADVRCFFPFQKKYTKENAVRHVSSHPSSTWRLGFGPFKSTGSIHTTHQFVVRRQNRFDDFLGSFCLKPKKTKEQYESVNVTYAMLPILAVGNVISPVQWKIKSYSAIQKEMIVLKARFPLNHYRRKKSTANLQDVYSSSVVNFWPFWP